jgi:hypothetical protein
MDDKEDSFRAAAAECLRAARMTADERSPAMYLLLAQKWLELSRERFGGRRFDALLDDFNEQQMRPKR